MYRLGTQQCFSRIIIYYAACRIRPNNKVGLYVGIYIYIRYNIMFIE